jgi:hypothetical protein
MARELPIVLGELFAGWSARLQARIFTDYRVFADKRA